MAAPSIRGLCASCRQCAASFCVPAAFRRSILCSSSRAACLSAQWPREPSRPTLTFVNCGRCCWQYSRWYFHAAAAWASSARRHAVGKTVDALRMRTLRALATRDPRVVQEESGQWRHVLTRGMEDFRPYLSQFLPALVAVCIATCGACYHSLFRLGLCCLRSSDAAPHPGVYGAHRRAHRATHAATPSRHRRARRPARGSVRGAPTLRALHATKQPTRSVGSLGERHSKATMGVLRLAFLSSFALEFLATPPWHSLPSISACASSLAPSSYFPRWSCSSSCLRSSTRCARWVPASMPRPMA